MAKYSYSDIKKLRAKQQQSNDDSNPRDKAIAAEGLDASVEQLEANTTGPDFGPGTPRYEENRRVAAVGLPLSEFGPDGPNNFSGASEAPGFVDSTVKPLAFAAGRATQDIGQGFEQNVNLISNKLGLETQESPGDMAARLQREDIADERVGNTLFPDSQGTRQAMRGVVGAAPIAAGLAAGGPIGAAALSSMTNQRDEGDTVSAPVADFVTGATGGALLGGLGKALGGAGGLIKRGDQWVRDNPATSLLVGGAGAALGGQAAFNNPRESAALALAVASAGPLGKMLQHPIARAGLQASGVTSGQMLLSGLLQDIEEKRRGN